MINTTAAAPGRDFLDWDAAAWWATTLAPAGPTVSRGQARRVAQRLREASAAAPQLVAEVTGLEEASERAGDFPRLVVDRSGWAKANVEMFSRLTAGHLPAAGSLGAELGGALELGAMLSLLASRVLGQFDPFSARLYLVAPNIVHVRRSMGVDETDFVSWVCLHEQTHAVQFAAAPWLAEHLHAQIGALLDSMAQDPATRAWRTALRLPGAIRRKQPSPGGILTQAALTEAEHARLEDLVAVMSMLEGHADVVMDSAQSHVPSTRAIRERFTRRRDHPRFGEQVLRKVLGLDAKLNQYRDGARFVRAVLAEVDHAGFNRVFATSQNLPTAAEIAAPQQWLVRVSP